jgi:hypothetical protein
MKEINISVDDELYRRAQQTLDDVEYSVTLHVQRYLKSLDDDAGRIAAARTRMEELFRTTDGFGVGDKLTREEMHERGSFH